MHSVQMLKLRDATAHSFFVRCNQSEGRSLCLLSHQQRPERVIAPAKVIDSHCQNAKGEALQYVSRAHPTRP